MQQPKNIDISKMSVEQLKIIGFDVMNEIQAMNNNLGMIRSRLAQLQQKESVPKEIEKK